MSTGCTYVTHYTKRWNQKTNRFDDVPVHCQKLTAATEFMCPKHLLVAQDEEEEIERKKLARIEDRNQKKLRDQELAHSPLAAVNDEYENKKKAAWMEGTGYDR